MSLIIMFIVILFDGSQRQMQAGKLYNEVYINVLIDPDVLCDPTDLIWRKGTPFEAMNGPTASSDGLLAEVFLDCKTNARRSVHSPQYHFIITLIISN